MRLIQDAAENVMSLLGRLQQDPMSANQVASAALKQVQQIRNFAVGLGRRVRLPLDIAPDGFFIVPNFVAIAALQQGAAIPMKFPKDCAILAMAAGEVAGNDADLSLNLKIQGSADLISDGQAGAFAPVRRLAMGQGGLLNWTPLGIRVANGDIWNFTFKNLNAANPRTPEVLLAFKVMPN